MLTSFILTDPTPNEIYTLSLHDALPIWGGRPPPTVRRRRAGRREADRHHLRPVQEARAAVGRVGPPGREGRRRSEEHTSELQSRFDLVCRLLLEKKNTRRLRRS